MAEHRASGLCAALIAVAAAFACIGEPGAVEAKKKRGERQKPNIDRSCTLTALGAGGGDAAPTKWRGSAYVRPRGTIRAKLIFVQFPDAPAGSLGTAQLRSGLETPAERWLGEVSYRSARLRISAHPGWVTMPRRSTSYWPPGGAFQPELYIREAIAAADPSADFGDAEIVYIAAAPGSQILLSPAHTAPRVKADGGAVSRFVTLGQNIYGTAPTAAAAAMIQGTGHLISLPYLDDPTQAGIPAHRWAGSWDPMGEPQLLSHPNAWSKRKLGWLQPGRSILCIRRGKVTTTVNGLARRKGLRAITIRLSERRRYVVEARRRRGFDRELCGQGVLIWLIDGSRGSGKGPMRIQPARGDSGDPSRSCRRFGVSGALDRAAFGPGQAFIDRKRGVRVAVKRQTRTGFRVSVTRR